MQTTLLLLAAACALSAESDAKKNSSLSVNPTLTHCLVSVKDEAQVPAQEAGLLISLKGEEGMQVKRGDVLAQIDASERRTQRELALIQEKAAKEQAENDINVRYAEAASKVAEAEYQQAIEANQKVRSTFPEAEVRRLKLAWHRAFLQIEQSQFEQRIASFTSQTRAAEVEAAETNIRRRQVMTPIDGEIVSRNKHVGEWVNPGDTVLRVVHFEKLRVEGFLKSSEYDPRDVAQRPVTVEVELARGRRVRLPGKITYVSPLVQAGAEYRVWADVANRKEDDQWLMRPGLTAAMTIEVK